MSAMGTLHGQRVAQLEARLAEQEEILEAQKLTLETIYNQGETLHTPSFWQLLQGLGAMCNHLVLFLLVIQHFPMNRALLISSILP